jgi:hypothetical protein
MWNSNNSGRMARALVSSTGSFDWDFCTLGQMGGLDGDWHRVPLIAMTEST